MPYGRRKKGGQRLMEMAKRRRLKAIKDKAGRLAPMVIEPTLSSLRTATPAQRRRISKPKGGQRLMEMAKKRRKKADAPRRKSPAQARKFGARIPVESRSPATKAQQPKRRATPTKAKKSAVPPSLPKKMRGRPPLTSKVINYVKEHPVEVAAELVALHPIGRGVKWGATLAKGAHKAYKLRKAEKLRKANNARKARERRARIKSEKTEEAYKQFEKDRKERSRKMGQRR